MTTPPETIYCELCKKAPVLPGYQFCATCWAAMQRADRPAALGGGAAREPNAWLAALGGFCCFGILAFVLVAAPGVIFFGERAEAALRAEGLHKVALPFGLNLAQAVPLGAGILLALVAGVYGGVHARSHYREDGRVPVWAYAGIGLLAFAVGGVFGLIDRLR